MNIPRYSRGISWALVIAWMGVIYFFSSRPDLRSGLQPLWDYILRKIAHTIEYAVLAILVIRAGRASGLSRKKSALLGFIVASAYAATDEYHQTFIHGRHGSPVDWLIDTCGALIISWLWWRRQAKKKPLDAGRFQS